MADREERYEDNVPGRFYVDRECINCLACSEIAPENFSHSSEGDHDFVRKQPTNEREENLCLEAMETCPVEAIGDDGNL